MKLSFYQHANIILRNRLLSPHTSIFIKGSVDLVVLGRIDGAPRVGLLVEAHVANDLRHRFADRFDLRRKCCREAEVVAVVKSNADCLF